MNVFMVGTRRTGGVRPGSAVGRFGKWLSASLAVLLFGTGLVTAGGAAVPAQAMEGATLQLVKQVDGRDSRMGLRPGDTVEYRVEFSVEDEDADAPVRIVDQLPAEFAGWEIGNLTAAVGGSTAGVTLDLPGIASGPASSTPASGALGSSAEDRAIVVGIALPVQAGAGNDSGLGMSTGKQGVLRYRLTVPSDISPLDPILNKPLVNTATFTARSGAEELRKQDTATISVEVPVAVDVTPRKTWTPSSQSYQPGRSSSLTIGATQASNVAASSLSLQDPADPALAPAGATALPAGNPFNYVDFAGFASPADPTTNLPAGATAASVEVYRLSGGTWDWAPWDASIPNDRIAGVRTSYSGSIPPGTEVAQGFTVTQRTAHRGTGESISTGYETKNDVRATVQVPGQPSKSKTAEAPFQVAPERIGVAAEKRFYSLPGGGEQVNLTGVTAGDSVGVVLRAKNRGVPQSTVLDHLTIVEPSGGSSGEFFGQNLIFGGFAGGSPAEIAKIWPEGATKADITWQHAGGPTTVSVNAGQPLPAPPAGVTGFVIDFSGEIAPGAESEIRYVLDSNPADDFVGAGETKGPFRNNIDVTGKKTALPDATASDGASVSYVAPRIDVRIDKRVGPGTVMPGDDVVVQLDTKVEVAGGRTKPTEIVVEDVMPASGVGTFWDAFDAKRILPPISRPVNGGVQADLRIEYRDASGAWNVLANNPPENTPIDLTGSAAGATGLRFVYTNTSPGLSQISYVKPNVLFEARALTRTGLLPTAGAFTDPKVYENTATADGTGVLDGRTVTGHDEDKVNVGIRGTQNGTGPGPGGIWADKDWAHSNLTSQSGATSWTTQSWVVAQRGYPTVRLQDPAAPTASGAGTVFEAFDLTQIRPIRYTGPAGNGTVDPLLRWDTVTDVQLFDGSDWTSIPAPSGGWMSADGFTGYGLSTAQQRSTVGVRLVVVENTAARRAAAEAGDLTAPAVGSGVAASAEIRTFRLDWQLRDRARTADGSLKWVKETGTAFNCSGGGDGCVDNVFGVTAIPETGPSVSDTGNDTIQLLDGATNVELQKQVRTMPGGTPGEKIDLIAPNAGELAPEDYPLARYTLTARNSSTTPQGSRGAMKLGKIRVTDTSTACGVNCPIPQDDFDIDESPFAQRNFATEAGSADGNHFDEFDLTGVSFGSLPSYIDRQQSTVELWLYDGTPNGTTRVFALQEVLDGDAAFVAELPRAIGVSATYSGTDPAQNGNRIAVGDQLTMQLDVRLRATERLSGEPVRGAGLGSTVNVPNKALARGWDAVVAPETQPTDTDGASIGLTAAQVKVGLSKAVAVAHPGSAENKTVYETDPQAPVSVLLTADDAGTTAPLDDLVIEDATASFWSRFELVSFGTPSRPTDADRATLEVLVNGAWEPFAGYDGPLADVRGARAVFDREDGRKFPLGATSWSASWGTAALPFTVKLRSGATVDWTDDHETNTAVVRANNTEYGRASADADDRVDFSPGVNAIEVVKRAPNDTSGHRVDPLVSLPWKLVFTNTGSSYLPITRLTDALPATLDWDGEQPKVTVTPGPGGSGMGDAPETALSSGGRELVFTWPAGQRMHPGERVEIELGLILQPVAAGQRATNEVIVETGVPLDTCTQPSDHGQDPQAPAAANLCTNTNFVEPEAGTVIGARKTVNGEPADTLGENLVTGALDVRSGEDCAAGGFVPAGSDYTRNPCASYTAVGATDTWKLEHMNAGTNPLSRMTIVDMLPRPGDKMLAGGAARGSTFRPVLRDPSDIRLSGLPSGATHAIEVTTNPAACVGSGSGSQWLADPECADTTTNPANVWVSLADYNGPVEEIAGLRIKVDMSATPLPPAGNVVVEFETVNRVVEQGSEGLQPTLQQFADRQFAWNQNGFVAWDTASTRVNLPKAPQKAGVTVKTGSLTVSKEVLGDGADNAPDSFPVELSCTVPSGTADPQRVALDLGAQASLTVPKNGSVTVRGIPIGADCTARESGDVGAHGEAGRSIAPSPGVTPATDGLSAEVRIREAFDGGAALLSLSNTYTLGELVVEKAAVSSNEHPLDKKQQRASFGFELVCTVAGSGREVRRVFELRAGEQRRETGLPVGVECVLTETRTGGAVRTTTIVAGDERTGTKREGIAVTAAGGHVLVSNVLTGVAPVLSPDNRELEETGGKDGTLLILVALSMLVIGVGGATAGIVLSRRDTPGRRRSSS